MRFGHYLPLCALLTFEAAIGPPPVIGQQPYLTPVERRIADHAEQDAAAAVALLERTVNINSGTLNLAGVQRVADLMEPAFRELGFETRWVPMSEVGRAGHLIAERRGTRGRSLLLIGHLDTVFEEDSPFQRYELVDDSTARGPGIGDMKGGNVALLFALRALHAAGALDNTTMTVILIGDEERPGQPLEIARRDLIEAGMRSEVALGFEGGSHANGVDLAVVGRRSASSWELRVEGVPAHSSVVFSEHAGAGAINEAARVLYTFYAELRGEPNLTFNAGLILGGTEAAVTAEARGTAAGKTNIVAEHAVVQGDIRTISEEQLERTRDRMRQIVARGLPGTRAIITFNDGYPAMTPTAGNHSLLAEYDHVSQALGFGRVEAHDPALRGAADISFVARHVDGLDGLGPVGTGAHTVRETVNLNSLLRATARAAILIHRLTR